MSRESDELKQTGTYTVRVDNPDGSYHVSTSPSLDSALRNCGFDILDNREHATLTRALLRLAELERERRMPL